MKPDARERQRMGAAALTESQVAHIKHRLFSGAKARNLAEEYGVGLETIRRINRGDTWGWVIPRDPKEIPKQAFDEHRSLSVLQNLVRDIQTVRSADLALDQLKGPQFPCNCSPDGCALEEGDELYPQYYCQRRPKP